MFLFLDQEIVPSRYKGEMRKDSFKSWKKRIFNKYNFTKFPISPRISQSRLNYNDESDRKTYTIPLESELDHILKQSHVVNQIHLKSFRTIERMKWLGIKYLNFTNDIEEYVKKCFSCQQKIPPRIKSTNFNPIVTSFPKELIQIVHLDKKISKDKYLINTIDHFSKYAWSYVVDNFNYLMLENA